MKTEIVLEVKILVKYFPVMKKGIILSKRIGWVHAVDDISFTVKKNETVGLVGESGCGKTTTARCILNLITPTAGELYFKGKNITKIFKSKKDKKRILELRRKMQYIFQDPWASLNPRWKISDTLLEGIAFHKIFPKEEYPKKLHELLNLVGLNAYHAYRYPHEFSGGQRQRIVVARAISLQPEFLIADEPVAMVDVSVRAQILNLLKDLQKKLHVSYLYISHDLASVKHICHRVLVMYVGKLVEIANTDELFSNQTHPYTQALLSAIPVPDPTRQRKIVVLKGEVPSPIDPPKGCRFHMRCSYATSICKKTEPKLREIRQDHFVACYHA